MQLVVRTEHFPLKEPFSISRGSRTETQVVTAIIRDGHVQGWGEAVPYPHYGETIEKVLDAIEQARTVVEAGDQDALQHVLPPGSARNVLDCALWDFYAKKTNNPAWKRAGLDAPPKPVLTAYTISLDRAEKMADQAARHRDRPLQKIKLGGPDDAQCLQAVRAAAPDSRLIVDANEGWDHDRLEPMLELCSNLDVEIVEQPLPAGKDEILTQHPPGRRKLLLCADESFHVADDVHHLSDRYDAVNIKLDKTGGLTEALLTISEAKRVGMQIMLGSMVCSSLGVAPAFLLASSAHWVDLDGPLLLAQDRKEHIKSQGSILIAPEPELWG